MKKRILTLLAAVCLLSAVLSGCGGGSQTGTTENTDQSTLDPHKTVKAGTREVMFNVFEGLLNPTPAAT